MSNVKVKFRKGEGTPATFNNGDIIFDKGNKKLSMKVDDTVITAGNVTYDVVSNKYQFNETVNPPAEAVEGDIEFTILNGEFPGTEVTHIALGTEEGFTITVREEEDPVQLKYNGISNIIIQMTTASSVEGIMNWIDDNAVNSIKGQLKDANTGANIIPEIESSGATWGSITGNIQDQGDLNTRLTSLENGKQDTLVGEGTDQNIKTVNGENILGTGDIEIEAAPKWIEKEAEMLVSWEKQSSNVNGTDIDVKFQYGPEASLDQENGTISVATDTNKVSVDMNGVRITLQNAEEGKVLSSNDFTDEYKTKLEGIAASATQVEVSDTGTAEEEVNYITITTANGHGTQKKIGGGANFTIGAGPLVIPQETTVNSASQQDWDPNYEYKYKFDIAVNGITATTRLTNMVAVLNTAYDNLAPNFDTADGGLTFYTKESALSGEITFSSYDIFTKNIKHDIDINVTGSGSINAIPNKQVAGKQITLEINPDEGYALGAMTVKDAQDNDITVDENNKFTMPDSNVIVTASFGDARTITLGDVEHGCIFASTSQAAQGAIIKLDNTPDEGYVLDAWDVKTSHAVSITVTDDKFEMPDEDVSVNATFKTA